jgi:predicted DNA-binding transcriptional regulator AlpA
MLTLPITSHAASPCLMMPSTTPADCPQPSPAASRLRKAAPRTPPGLFRAPDAAAYTGVSTATWWRWDSSGLCPVGLKIGGCRLWSRRELDAWIDANCPARETWEALKKQNAQRAAALGHIPHAAP